jgi:hypothetical protein
VPTAASETETRTREIRVSDQPVDSAIDEALRSVPLPQGLLTRLGLIAYSISEDSADQVDWLGC